MKLIHEVRAVKKRNELGSIVKAQRISERVLTRVLGKLQTGITEIEVEQYIRKQFRKFGTDTLAFAPLVAFGKNTANIHHFIPTKTKLKVGDAIMLDFGTTVNHYCSDMTRTFFWGEPTKKQRRVYLDVLRAQEIAIGKISKGEKRAKLIDSSARSFLAKKYKNNFKHGLGHGIGTVIHEWPNFKPKTTDILPSGVVMTVEPGIYLRGWGGVRIEDMVLITKDSMKNLTKFPKNLDSAILQI